MKDEGCRMSLRTRGHGYVPWRVWGTPSPPARLQPPAPPEQGPGTCSRSTRQSQNKSSETNFELSATRNTAPVSVCGITVQSWRWRTCWWSMGRNAMPGLWKWEVQLNFSWCPEPRRGFCRTSKCFQKRRCKRNKWYPTHLCIDA